MKKSKEIDLLKNLYYIEHAQSPEFVQPLSNAEADENSTVELLAHIKGNPTPKIEWSHAGSILRNGPHYEVTCCFIRLLKQEKKICK